MTRAFAGYVFHGLAIALFVFPILPLLYLLEPLVKVRIGILYTRRIGHLAFNTDALLRRIQKGGPESRNFYILVGCDPSSRQLLRMLKRHIRILYSRWATRLGFAWRPVLSQTRFWKPLHWEGTEFKLINSTRPTLAFTEDEELKGTKKLADMGIGSDDWFVCFHARESTYLQQKYPDSHKHSQMIEYKNCDIANYLKAAEYIVSLGGFAIRMGAIVKEPLPRCLNPRIIDYSTTCRSDFMDIYLAAKCRFFLGASSGMNSVPTIFGVPNAVANHIPHTHTHYDRRDLVIPRLIERRSDQMLVSFREATDAGFQAGSQGSKVLITDDHPFRWRESSPNDILDLCKDMLDALENRAPSSEQQFLQEYYAQTFFSHLPDYQLGAKVAPRFLAKHQEAIFSINLGTKSASQ